LRRQGKLRTAGTFNDGDGYLDIFEAEDRHEAESITRSSPLVEAGWASWTLREWSEYRAVTPEPEARPTDRAP
jgi:uncharacterized protein YciI